MNFSGYAWWPYVFMVCSLFIFLCILLVACRKWLIRKYRETRETNTVASNSIRSRDEDRSDDQQEEETVNSDATNGTTTNQPLRVYTMSGGGGHNPGYSTDGDSGIVLPSDINGPVIYSLMPPPYSDKPPLYEDIYKESVDTSVTTTREHPDGVAAEPTASVSVSSTDVPVGLQSQSESNNI